MMNLFSIENQYFLHLVTHLKILREMEVFQKDWSQKCSPPTDCFQNFGGAKMFFYEIYILRKAQKIILIVIF